ncbi:MAG: hypothetical protein ACRD0H_22135, partial [Actinomycetes bacterium]
MPSGLPSPAVLLAGSDLDCDLAADPLGYPGPPVPWSCWCADGHVERVGASPEAQPGSAAADFDARLRRAGAAPLSARHLVVAVGSNACAGVMARKLGPAPIPFGIVQVRGVRAGYSAHVSVRGYVPAAPFADPDADTRAVAAWLDDAQLAALDRTEPNY